MPAALDAPFGPTIDEDLTQLASVSAAAYAKGDLHIIAGAGVSQAAGLPGWATLVNRIAERCSAQIGLGDDRLRAVLERVHRADPLGLADSLRRLMGARPFTAAMHASLYAGTDPEATFLPSESHLHLASLVDPALMPELTTTNYDDLLEDALSQIRRAGRVEHLHGVLAQSWNRSSRLHRPPVVATSDYLEAEAAEQYERLRTRLRATVTLLVGVSLADPQLVRVIREEGANCNALVVATPWDLSASEQELRLNALRDFWQEQGISVVAVQTHQEVPAFLAELRRSAMVASGQSPTEVAARAWKQEIRRSPETGSGQAAWRDTLSRTVSAARTLVPILESDRSLEAGAYLIQPDGWLQLSGRSSMSPSEFLAAPRRRLSADPARPWGAAGYSFTAGLAVSASSGRAAFDRNVPEQNLLEWQQQRAEQGRLPPAYVLCVPVHVTYNRQHVPVGVMYLASRRSPPVEPELILSSELISLLETGFASMLRSF